jgi:hypothetical protein
MIHEPCFAAASIIARRSPSCRTAPVGLLGLQIAMALVRGPISRPQGLNVGPPFSLLLQPERNNAAAPDPAQSVNLHVVRQHDDDLVIWLEQTPARDKVRFRGAIRDQDVVASRAGIERRNLLS